MGFEAVRAGLEQAIPFNRHLGLEVVEEGRVEFPIAVSLTDQDGTEVAKVTVDWHVRKNG